MEEIKFICRKMEQIYNEGIENGELKKAKEIALFLAQSEFTIDKIAQIVQINIATVQKWIDERCMSQHKI